MNIHSIWNSRSHALVNYKAQHNGNQIFKFCFRFVHFSNNQKWPNCFTSTLKVWVNQSVCCSLMAASISRMFALKQKIGQRLNQVSGRFCFKIEDWKWDLPCASQQWPQTVLKQIPKPKTKHLHLSMCFSFVTELCSHAIGSNAGARNRR